RRAGVRLNQLLPVVGTADRPRDQPGRLECPAGDAIDRTERLGEATRSRLELDQIEAELPSATHRRVGERAGGPLGKEVVSPRGDWRAIDRDAFEGRLETLARLKRPTGVHSTHFPTIARWQSHFALTGSSTAVRTSRSRMASSSWTARRSPMRGRAAAARAFLKPSTSGMRRFCPG